jgi:ethanolamine permease
VKYFPGALGKVQKKFQTPANALIINMFVGIAALFTGKTGDIITISVFGALLLYIISMLSLFALRKKHPKIPRPFKVPMYPLFPAIALIIATVSFVALCFYYPIHALIFGALMGAGYAYFFFFVRARAEHHVHLHETLQTAD